MALTVTNQLTTIIDCDTATGWTGSDPTIGLDTDIYYEPNGSIAWDTDIEIYYATYTWGSDQNFTDLNVYFWFLSLTASYLDTWQNGGVGLRLEDASGNWSEWFCGGKDTYAGGWKRFVVYTGSTPDERSTTAPLMAQIRKLRIRVKALVSSKLPDNTFVDYIQTGTTTGIKVTGGITGAKNLDELVAQDQAVYAGIISKSGGVYFVNGPIQFGDETSGDINFLDTNQVLLTENWFRSFTTAFRTATESLVSSTHYTIIVVNNSGGDGKFQLGNKSGSQGIEGCVLKSGEAGVNGRKLIFTAIDADIDELKLYGCNLIDVGDVSLPPNASGREVLSCSFSGCGEILADTCIVQYCTIVNADNRGLRIASASHHVSQCQFISCGHCVHCNFSTAVDFNDLVFSGSDGISKYDIEHSVSGTLIISALGDSNPNENYVDETGSGSTTIDKSVYITVWVEDEAGNPVNLAQVAVYKQAGGTELMNKDTDGAGKAQESFNYPAEAVPVYIRVRKSSVGTTRYIPVNTTGSIEAGGLTTTVVLREDINIE